MTMAVTVDVKQQNNTLRMSHHDLIDMSLEFQAVFFYCSVQSLWPFKNIDSGITPSSLTIHIVHLNRAEIMVKAKFALVGGVNQ